MIVIAVIIIALSLLAGLFEKEEIETNEISKIKVDENTFDSTLIKMKLPAVDTDGRGVSTILGVEAVKAEDGGRTLVSIENLLFWADTQHSIRMARLVADNYTENSVDDYNLIYSVEANASVIGGPSAGAAITIATIFALNGKQPRDDVMITGGINHDGTIGPVNGILEKATASKQAGANIFLVPLLQSRDVIYETTEHCEKFGLSEVCSEESIPRKINVSEEAGIQIIEVESIREALGYFS